MKIHGPTRVIFLLLFGCVCFFAGLFYQNAKEPNDKNGIEILRDTSLDAEPLEVIYSPSNFKNEIRKFVDKREFSTAVALLDSVYVDDQIDYEDDLDHFFGVPGNQIMLPGADREFDYRKDWTIPWNGESILWFERAERFSKKYNSRVVTKKQRQNKEGRKRKSKGTGGNASGDGSN